MTVQNILFPVIILIGVLVTIAFLVMRVRKGGIVAMFLKSGASACFIATAFMAFSFNRGGFEYGVLMLLGLIFSLLGDIWLDLKYVHKDFSRPYTYAGFISFMMGHIFFMSAVLLGYDNFKLWYFVLAFIVCCIVAGVAMAMEKLNKNLQYGEYKLITFIYSFFVAGTMALSITGMTMFGFEKKYIVLTIGSIAFLLSDLVLSSIYFEKGKNTKANVLLNHILYYFAQFAFASTLLMK